MDRQFRCAGCGSPLRVRDLAQVLIDEYGDGRQQSLSDLTDLDWFQQLRTYYVGSAQQRIRRTLAQAAHHTESRYEPDLPLGDALEEHFVNQDLQALTFADQSFDLVVSIHVLEHVADPWRAFAEMWRVLRPGGRMIHAIPSRYPLKPDTRTRARLVDGQIEHLEPEQYHNSPEGRPALVFSDFGADLKPRLEAIGFEVSLRRPHLQLHPARRNLVLVGRRPPE